MDYVAQIDGYYLDIIGVTDTFDMAVVAHEFPFSNDNKLQGLGQKTRKIKFVTAWTETPTLGLGWSAAGIQPTYENHYKFLDIIKKSTHSQLTHPKYGSLTGFIQNITVEHDDTLNYAAITFDFLVESTPAFEVEKPLSAEQSAKFTAINEDMKLDFKSEKLTLGVEAYTTAANKMINTLDDWLNNITSPADSIKNVIYYSTSIEDQLLSSINTAVDRIMTGALTVINAPATVINNMVQGVRQLAAKFTGLESRRVRIIGASRVSYESAKLYEADNDKYKKEKRLDNTEPFDANGNYAGPVVYEPIMTIYDLDNSVYQVKDLIDDVIQDDRAYGDLVAQAVALQDYVNTQRLTRESIEEKEIPLQSMHQLIMTVGLDYHRADQILKLNPSIHNPTFSQGAVRYILPKE
jgi:prophage DNA circulation protein